MDKLLVRHSPLSAFVLPPANPSTAPLPSGSPSIPASLPFHPRPPRSIRLPFHPRLTPLPSPHTAPRSPGRAPLPSPLTAPRSPGRAPRPDPAPLPFHPCAPLARSGSPSIPAPLPFHPCAPLARSPVLAPPVEARTRGSTPGRADLATSPEPHPRPRPGRADPRQARKLPLIG